MLCRPLECERWEWCSDDVGGCNVYPVADLGEQLASLESTLRCWYSGEVWTYPRASAREVLHGQGPDDGWLEMEECDACEWKRTVSAP